jgi:hypothetical protein
MISIVSLFLVFVRLIVLLFFRLGNAIRFRCPLPEIDQLATLGTKRTIRVGRVPGDNLAAPGTINNRWFHNHSLEKQNGRSLRPITAAPLLIQIAVIGPQTVFPRFRDAIRIIWPISPQIRFGRIAPPKSRVRNREDVSRPLIYKLNLMHAHLAHE